MSISPDAPFLHYRIISKLGAEGMGEVYLAQDTKLDRKNLAKQRYVRPYLAQRPPETQSSQR